MKVFFSIVFRLLFVLIFFQSASLKAKLSSSMDLSGALESSDNGDSNSASPANVGGGTSAVSADFEIAEEIPRGGHEHAIGNVSSSNGSFARSTGSIVNPNFSDVLLSVETTEQAVDNLAKVGISVVRCICIDSFHSQAEAVATTFGLPKTNSSK